MRQAVVARVLSEEGRVGEVLEKVRLSLVNEVETETRAIAGSPLSVGGVVVFGLAYAGVEACGKKSDGIDGVLGEEKKLVLEREDAQPRAGRWFGPGQLSLSRSMCRVLTRSRMPS